MNLPVLNVWRERIRLQSLLRLALLAVIAPGAVAYGFLFHSAVEARELLQDFGYFAMMVTVAWWIWSLTKVARHEPALMRAVSGSGLKRHRAAWWLIAGFTAVAWCTVPYSYKILYDEFVLQSTALNLHFFRELGTLVRGHEVEGVFRSLDIYLDKRPFFYPFLVSLLHDLTGYRAANAFVLNTLLMPVVLGLVYLIARPVGGRQAAVVALACFGASPLLAQNANGTGMEMLNLAMFLTTLGLSIYYLEKPDEARLSALVLSCVLLAQTRYESALYVGCAGLVILEGWRRAGRVIIPVAGLCAPVLLIPCALHNTYLSGTPELWELRADVASRFSVQHLWSNLGHAVNYFFGVHPSLLNNGWLSVLGALAAAGAAASLWIHRSRWRSVPPVILASLVMLIGVVANLGLLMAYFWGQLDDPMVSRLALPLYAMLALAVAWAVGRCRAEWQSGLCAGLIAGALLTYLAFGLRTTAYHIRMNQLTTEIAWEEQWVSQRPQVNRLMITNKTALNWMLRKTSAISIDMVRSKAAKVRFHMDAGTFREVLVSQYYRPVGAEGGFVLDPRDALPEFFVLEPLIERQHGARLLRISRVTAINLPVSAATASPATAH